MYAYTYRMTIFSTVSFFMFAGGRGRPIAAAVSPTIEPYPAVSLS